MAHIVSSGENRDGQLRQTLVILDLFWVPLLWIHSCISGSGILTIGGSLQIVSESSRAAETACSDEIGVDNRVDTAGVYGWRNLLFRQ